MSMHQGKSCSEHHIAYMNERLRDSTQSSTSDAFEKKKHRNLVKMVGQFYTESVVLKCMHLTTNMTVYPAKDLKVACGGVCCKGCNLSCEEVGLLLAVQSQREGFSTRCEWVWLTIHLGDV